jgi:enoyl-[acyl-carrier-protein] reductase (NADH)
VILTFTADAARLAYPNVGSFGIACAAVEGLTRALAAELGPAGGPRRVPALDGLARGARR